VRRLILFIFFITFEIAVYSQQIGKFYLLKDTSFLSSINQADRKILDSLLTIYHNKTQDTEKVQILRQLIDMLSDEPLQYKYNAILYNIVKKIIVQYPDNERIIDVYAFSLFYQGEYYLNSKQMVDSAKYFYSKALKVFSKINDYSGMGDCYAQLGFIKLIYESKLLDAIDYYKNALHLYKRNKDTSNIAFALSSLAYLYDELGDVDSAISVNMEALNIAEKLKDYRRMAVIFNNLGTILYHQYDNDTIGIYLNKAISYFKKAIKYFELSNYHSHIANALNNIGIIYDNLKKGDSAMYYYRKAYQNAVETKNLYIQSLALRNIGNFYASKGKKDSARFYYNKGLNIALKSKNINAIVSTLTSIADLNMKENNYDKALKYLNQANKLLVNYKKPLLQLRVYDKMSRVYAWKGNYAKAYKLLLRYLNKHDSLINQQTQKAILSQQLKYEYQKREALKEAEYKHKMQILEEKRKRSSLITKFVIILTLVVVAFLALLYNRFLLLKKQNNIIKKQRDEIARTQRELKERNKALMDSINYARHIQRGIMPMHTSKEGLPEYFILFMPRDVVSGDFFWNRKIGNSWYVVVADCTGHGVPGALLSFLGISYLNEIFASNTELQPDYVLESMRERLSKDFATSVETHNFDGIDMILLKIDLNTLKIEWSSANRPLWILSKQGELIVFKAFRQTVGFNFKPKNFQLYSYQAAAGDIIYMFSDGYIDQIGGYDKRMKFGKENFKSLIVSMRDVPIKEQKDIFLQKLNDWSTGYKQIDDILVVGIKL